MAEESQKTDNAAQTDAPSAESTSQPKKEGVNWADPNVPAGNSPPLPRWPLILSALAFGGWLAFLIVMAVLRIQTTPF